MTRNERIELIENALSEARNLRPRLQAFTAEYEMVMQVIINLQTLRLDLQNDKQDAS